MDIVGHRNDICVYCTSVSLYIICLSCPNKCLEWPISHHTPWQLIQDMHIIRGRCVWLGVVTIIPYDIHVVEQTMKWSIKMTNSRTDWVLTSVPPALAAECRLVNSWQSEFQDTLFVSFCKTYSCHMSQNTL